MSGGGRRCGRGDTTYASSMMLVSSELRVFTRLGVPKRCWWLDLDHGAVFMKNAVSDERACAADTPVRRSASSGWRVQKYPWVSRCCTFRPSSTSSQFSCCLMAPDVSVSGFVRTPGQP